MANWRQRKTLGLYPSGDDPELALAERELSERYKTNLALSGIKEQRRQFDKNVEMQERNANKQGVASAVGTLGNLGGLYLMSQWMKPGATPALANAGSGIGSMNLSGGGTGFVNMPGGTALAPSVTAPAASGATAPATATVGTTAAGATAPAGLSSASLSSLSGLSGWTSALGSLPGYVYAAPIAMGTIGGMVGKTRAGEQVGHVLTLGSGGQKEKQMASSVSFGLTHGAGAGATIGGVYGGPVGAVVGGVVGAVLGGASAAVTRLVDDSYLCSKIDTIEKIEQQKANNLNALRDYAIRHNRAIWKAYRINGPRIVAAIDEAEPEAFWTDLKAKLIDRVTSVGVEEGFEIYLSIVKELSLKYLGEEFKAVEE